MNRFLRIVTATVLLILLIPAYVLALPFFSVRILTRYLFLVSAKRLTDEQKQVS